MPEVTSSERAHFHDLTQHDGQPLELSALPLHGQELVAKATKAEQQLACYDLGLTVTPPESQQPVTPSIQEGLDFLVTYLQQKLVVDTFSSKERKNFRVRLNQILKSFFDENRASPQLLQLLKVAFEQILFDPKILADERIFDFRREIWAAIQELVSLAKAEESTADQLPLLQHLTQLSAKILAAYGYQVSSSPSSALIERSAQPKLTLEQAVDAIQAEYTDYGYDTLQSQEVSPAQVQLANLPGAPEVIGRLQSFLGMRAYTDNLGDQTRRNFRHDLVEGVVLAQLRSNRFRKSSLNQIYYAAQDFQSGWQSLTHKEQVVLLDQLRRVSSTPDPEMVIAQFFEVGELFSSERKPVQDELLDQRFDYVTSDLFNKEFAVSRATTVAQDMLKLFGYDVVAREPDMPS